MIFISCGDEKNSNVGTEIDSEVREDTIQTNVLVFLIPGLDQKVMSLLMRDPTANLIKNFNNIGYYAPKSYFEPYADIDANVTALMSGSTTLPGLAGMDKDSSILKTWVDNFRQNNYQIALITDGLLGMKPLDAIFPGSYDQSLAMENTVSNMISKKPDFVWGVGRQLFDRRKDKKLLFEEMSINDYHLNFDISNKSLGSNSRYAGIYYYYSAPDTVDMISEGINTWYRFTNRTNRPFLGIISINSLEERLASNDLQSLWKISGYMEEMADLLASHMENTLVLVINPFQDQRRVCDLVEGDSVSYSSTPMKMNQTYLPIWASGKNAYIFNGYYENTDLFNKMKGIASSENN
jgi:alkaline phosphatase